MAPIPDALTIDELIRLRYLGTEGYVEQVTALFVSGRATPAHWRAMAETLLHAHVLEIDRAIVRHLEAEQERSLAQALKPSLENDAL